MKSKLDHPQDRGAFIRAVGTLFAGMMAEKLEEALEGLGPKLLRPPGALNELAFLTECARCGRCILACPQGTLKAATASAGLAMGTPHMVPREMPCFLCEGLPCIAACPKGALLWPKSLTEAGERLEGAEAVRIGVAQIKKTRCLTHETPTRQAGRCRACVERCPYPGKAICLRVYGKSRIPQPEVLKNGCTGCGLCEYGCPAPLPGIVVGVRQGKS